MIKCLDPIERGGEVMLTPVTMYKPEKCAANKRYATKYLSSFFLQNMGCSRKVYNLFVDDLYKQLESAGYENGDLPDIKIPEVTAFKSKPEYKYLNDADSLALANAKIDFVAAVNRYSEDFDHESYTARAIRRNESGTEKLSFRGLKGMPKFHSKARGYFSYRTNCQYPSPSNSLKRPTIRLEGNKLYLPKCKEAIIESTVNHQHNEDCYQEYWILRDVDDRNSLELVFRHA